jgi:pimeloyl-ACP methyl ester carboxylesterase
LGTATIFAICAGLCISVVAPAARAAEAMNCHVGAYRLSDGGIVDIAASNGNTLRWRRFDGATGALTGKSGGVWTSSYGWTGRSDGKSVDMFGCGSERINFDGMKGRRLRFDATDTTFTSHGARLAGRLILPKGTGVVPIVVLLHGGEHDSARQFNALQRLLPAEKIGAFVFDKRGTGGSDGSYSQDFDLLADDAVAAMREARRLSGKRAGRVGYQAGSQGGWVAPLAANRASVDFVIVCFGLAVSVIDEDQQEVEIEMREKGHSAAEIANAQEVARAAETVISSGFSEGFEQFDAVRAKYENSSWYKDLHGNYTYALLPYSESQLREMSSKFKWGTPFHYDPMPALRSNTTPQLWILGGEDYEAPSAETSRRVKSLIADALPFTLAVYPRAEHGMTLFEIAPGSGERLSTRYAPHYFSMIRDFARYGELRGVYDDAEITSPKGGDR